MSETQSKPNILQLVVPNYAGEIIVTLEGQLPRFELPGGMTREEFACVVAIRKFVLNARSMSVDMFRCVNGIQEYTMKPVRFKEADLLFPYRISDCAGPEPPIYGALNALRYAEAHPAYAQEMMLLEKYPIEKPPKGLINEHLLSGGLSPPIVGTRPFVANERPISHHGDNTRIVLGY